MSCRIESLMVAFLGLFLVGIAIYFQWTVMDLARYPLSSYFDSRARTEGWWAVAGVPFLVGLAYLLAGAYWSVKHTKVDVTSLSFFVTVLVASTAVLAVFRGYGLFMTLMSALIFVAFMIKYLRQRKSPA